ncbi:thioredoxin [bacterium]|nr:thioredoxin [bacterium]
MKKASFFRAMFITGVLGVLLAAPIFAQDEEPVLTGPLEIPDLLELPGWFGDDFVSYTPDPQYTGELSNYMTDVSIICVLGTWCSDSKREVPRLLRILQVAGITPEKLQMIGVDREKKSPGGEAAPYHITHVPTFVFLRDGKEIGRIVEEPLATLERDMMGILMVSQNGE